MLGQNHFTVRLHDAQAEIWNSTARFKVAVAGRRFGKSHFAAYCLIVEGLKTENEYGYRLTAEHGVYYIAPTFDQAKRVMWPKLRELAGYETQGGLIRNENVNDGWIELINGRRIYIKGADNPNTLRGIALSFVVLDEYADMRPEVWEEIVDPALMDVRGGALFIGTPKGRNHFFRLYMCANRTPPDDFRNYKAEDWSEWEAFHYTTLDNPFIAQGEINRMMTQSNKPSEVIRQEIEASFISGGGTTLNPDDWKIVAGLPRSPGRFYITVDLAGFATERGKAKRLDESVIAATFVEDGTGDWYVSQMEHGHWDPREVALRIVRMVSRHPGCRLGIEKGALMNAVLGYLNEFMREYNRYVTPEPLTHANTKKADRIHWALQGRAERGRCHLVRGEWNAWFLGQLASFPDPLARDDGIDTVAYVDQMATVTFASDHDVVEWEVLDLDSGY